MPADACAKMFHPDPASNISWMEKGRDPLGARAVDIHETNDGGYILIGTTGSSLQDPTVTTGSPQILVRKLDSRHNVTWERTIGSSERNEGRKIREIQDGG